MSIFEWLFYTGFTVFISSVLDVLVLDETFIYFVRNSYIHSALTRPSLFVLILYVPSTIFQLYRDGSSWVEPVLS